MSNEKENEEKPDAPAPDSQSPVLDFILDTILPDRPGASERRRKDDEALEQAKEKPN